jgi:hypothetical protein
VLQSSTIQENGRTRLTRELNEAFEQQQATLHLLTVKLPTAPDHPAKSARLYQDFANAGFARVAVRKAASAAGFAIGAEMILARFLAVKRNSAVMEPRTDKLIPPRRLWSYPP